MTLYFIIAGVFYVGLVALCRGPGNRDTRDDAIMVPIMALCWPVMAILLLMAAIELRVWDWRRG